MSKLRDNAEVKEILLSGSETMSEEKARLIR